ncbi:uncharacterized protein LOC122265228 [Penaeus japonicus]|uniref:uncharacterized protein LOC122265228 n=1 Tax=Penaeus japonicus TaxID=27405 RepID=UPI001C7164CC|nr:uncharacterized protein LOC122265228 [Penaeus japonicus]
MQGKEIKKVNASKKKVTANKYLSSTVDCEESSNTEVKRRVQAGWSGWRKVTGVLCGRNIPIGVKGKIYWTFIRLAMIYGIEAVPITKLQEAKMEVAEIRNMVATRWLGERLREWRLRWFVYVKRSEENYVGRKNVADGTTAKET